jgi:hypothetical protein
VETENPSAYATVNWKVCKSVTALYLGVIKRTCNRGANKSNHPNCNPFFLSRLPLHVTLISMTRGYRKSSKESCP